MTSFSDLLKHHITKIGLPVRMVSKASGIPHQTIYNWMNGALPRRTKFLKDELGRLVEALGLLDKERDQLLRAAGCLPSVSVSLEPEPPKMYDHKTIPKGWFPAGHSPKAFDMGVHRTEHEPPAMFVRALPSPPGFGTVMQTFAAQRYLNQRIRFSAEVRATGVTEWAGLWMRVDDDKHESPSFDNMSDRPIVGTTD